MVPGGKADVYVQLLAENLSDLRGELGSTNTDNILGKTIHPEGQGQFFMAVGNLFMIDYNEDGSEVIGGG